MSPRSASSHLLFLTTLVVSVAACSAGSLPASAASFAAQSPPAASPTAAASDVPGSPTAATPTPLPARPPEARLGDLSGDALPGDEGSFSWDGLTSDAPWIVGRSAGTARAGTKLTIRFAPGVSQASWRARWAPVVGDGTGTPVDGGSGLDGAIELALPATPGAWSVQLTASFGAGRSATWYWRVEVAP